MSNDSNTISYQNIKGLNSNVVEVRKQIINSNFDVYIFTRLVLIMVVSMANFSTVDLTYTGGIAKRRLPLTK